MNASYSDCELLTRFVIASSIRLRCLLIVEKGGLGISCGGDDGGKNGLRCKIDLEEGVIKRVDGATFLGSVRERCKNQWTRQSTRSRKGFLERLELLMDGNGTCRRSQRRFTFMLPPAKKSLLREE